MEHPTPSRAAEIESLRAAYAALNRGDTLGFVAEFDPQIERIELIPNAEFPQGQVYRGLEAVKAHVSTARETWAEGGCYPERFIVAGDRIIVLVHVRARLKSETAWREGRTVDIYTFRDDKVFEFRTFIDERQAFEWAGVPAPR